MVETEEERKGGRSEGKREATEREKYMNDKKNAERDGEGNDRRHESNKKMERKK